MSPHCCASISSSTSCDSSRHCCFIPSSPSCCPRRSFLDSASLLGIKLPPCPDPCSRVAMRASSVLARRRWCTLDLGACGASTSFSFLAGCLRRGSSPSITGGSTPLLVASLRTLHQSPCTGRRSRRVSPSLSAPRASSQKKLCCLRPISSTLNWMMVPFQSMTPLPSLSLFSFAKSFVNCASSFCFSSSTLRCAAGIRTSMLVTLYVSLSSMARFLVVTSMSNTSVPGPHAASSHAL
mmetsp:Transcript_58446/g.137583  ORF Transcript_58446/g.137583 Transcript_58446/m.137583 type:complete len:238 (+) Transcript_58446:1062-1775(+)